MTPADLRHASLDWSTLTDKERIQTKSLSSRLRTTGLGATHRWLEAVKSDCGGLAQRLQDAHATRMDTCTHQEAMRAEARALRWAECLVLVARATDEDSP